MSGVISHTKLKFSRCSCLKLSPKMSEKTEQMHPKMRLLPDFVRFFSPFVCVSGLSVAKLSKTEKITLKY